jgi:flagellar hook protein FlgE
MSVFGAMISGVTGLNAQSQSLGMISDNISNVNTIGYKTTVARFSTLVTDVSRESYSPGGVRTRPFAEIDQQGLLQSTTSNTDLAISGVGFFPVSTAAQPGLGVQLLYTRNGSFSFDQDGNMLNSNGFYLQGWPYDPTGTTVTGTDISQLETINVAGLTAIAQESTRINAAINLDANSAVADTFNVDTTVVDALGATHNVRLQFTKTAANAWDVNALDVNGTITGTAGQDLNGGAAIGALTFNATNGTLNTPANGEITLNFPAAFNSSGATSPASIIIDFGTAGDTTGTTQFAGFNDIRSTAGDGIPTGSFTNVNIDEFGDVTALFDNGAQLLIYRIPLITFQNPNGLEVLDGNVYAGTAFSGTATPKNAQSGGSGTIVSASLESSTSDIGEEFTNMIITQRAFTAATRVITTADEMLEELVRIKR